MKKTSKKSGNLQIAEFMGHPTLWWDDPEYVEDQDYKVTSIIKNEDGETACITYNGGFSDAEVYLRELKPLKLKYHKSWNKLMPVVEKIEYFFDGEVEVNISDEICLIKCTRLSSGSICSVTESKLKSVYMAVVSFVTWYNDRMDKIDKQEKETEVIQ